MNVPLASVAVGYNMGRAEGTQFEELFDGVDDLIKRVADTENPEIRRIRAKVHASMAAAKNACTDRIDARPSAKDGASAINDETPDEALSVALLVGLGLGVIMSIQP